MWWADGSHSEGGRVGAAVVCKQGNESRTRLSDLETGRMEVLNVERWAIGLALGETVKSSDRPQENGVRTVAVFSD